MLRWLGAGGLFALGLLLLAGGDARAERVPSRKVVVPRTRLFQPTVRVPYLTNGYSALGVYQGVAPIIYATPIVNEPDHPQSRPVYNLPYYGARQAFGGGSQGAVDRRPQRLRP
jgi:hypothetical protein